MYGAPIMSAQSPRAAPRPGPQQAPPQQGGPADLAAIGDAIYRIVRQVQRRKAALSADPLAAEWAAHHMLEHISADGPVRAAYLAECTGSDPSTVSRHVAALVRDGLVERQPDPLDGSANLLACTSAGDAVVERLRGRRLSAMHSMLSDFAADELAALGGLLPRLAASMEEQPLDLDSPHSPSPARATPEGPR
ncbi:MAG: MarR family winged helix-turn-helix transcriptional regulator [Frankiaceae bacterium]|nr:MarR family winged helix-turn-helix transcriptional regulator [Frankiaceae bacterium]